MESDQNLSSMKGHYLTLDALRGVAAIIILIYHRRDTLPGDAIFHIENAYLAVDFFFILSGFVIALAYERKLKTGMSLAQFALVRAVRLYPLIILGGIIGAISMRVHGWGLKGLVGSAFAAAALPAPAFLLPEPFYVNIPVWSLFYEIVVNALYAIVVVARPKLLPCALAISAVAWIAMIATQGIGVGTNFDTLLWGVARAAFPFGLGVALHRYRGLFKIDIGIVAVCALLVVALVLPTPTGMKTVYAVACVLIVFPALVALGAGAWPSPQFAKIAAWLGAVSFPIYALHYPLYRIADHILDGAGISPVWEVAIFAPIFLALSTLAFYKLDVPVRLWLTRLIPANPHLN